MRRLLASLLLLASATGAHASLDAYTGFLFGQPLTRLDYLVINSRKTLEALFDRPADTDSVSRKLLDEAFAKKAARIERTTAVFDFDHNALQFFLIVRDDVPKGEDCSALLDAGRDRLIRSVVYENEALELNERTRGAKYLLSELLLTPSSVEVKGAPTDLVEHMAALTSAHVTIDATNDITKYVACSGTLGGTDVDLHLK